MKRLEQLSQVFQEQSPYDFIVVGCGISGLQTAEILAQEPLRFLVLEAQGYIGGRIQTISIQALQDAKNASWIASTPAKNVTLQKGATWIDESHKVTLKLCHTLGVPLFQQYPNGSPAYLMNGKSFSQTQILNESYYGPEIKRVVQLLEQLSNKYKNQVLDNIKKPTLKGQQFLRLCDSLIISDFFKKQIPEKYKAVRDIFENFIENMECLSCKKNSMRQFLTKYSLSNDFMNFKEFFKVCSEDETNYRFEQGTSSLIKTLIKQIEKYLSKSIDNVIKVNCQVLTIDNRYNNYVIVTARDAATQRIYHFKAKRVICSSPIAVCKQIRFTNISEAKSKIFDNQQPTGCNKAFIICKTAFWRPAYNGEGLFSQQYCVNMTHDVTPKNNSCGILVFQIAGEKQDRWQTFFQSSSVQEETKKKKNYLIDLMCKLFSVPETKKKQYFEESVFYEITYLHNQFIRSGYQSNTRPNTFNLLLDSNESLNRFYQDEHLITFVGSEFSLEYPSYIEGAISCARIKTYQLLNKPDPLIKSQREI